MSVSKVSHNFQKSTIKQKRHWMARWRGCNHWRRYVLCCSHWVWVTCYVSLMTIAEVLMSLWCSAWWGLLWSFSVQQQWHQWTVWFWTCPIKQSSQETLARSTKRWLPSAKQQMNNMCTDCVQMCTICVQMFLHSVSNLCTQDIILCTTCVQSMYKSLLLNGDMYPPTFFGLLVDRCDSCELWDWFSQLEMILPEANPCWLRLASVLWGGLVDLKMAKSGGNG